MPDRPTTAAPRPRPTRRARFLGERIAARLAARLAPLLLLGTLAVAIPAAALAAPPAETCSPQETRSAGGFQDICGAPPAGGGGGGVVNLGGLLPILGVVAAAGVIALIAAFVVLRRTSAPMAPADPGEWWTCTTCGKTNVIGSARCYACGTWQR
jgi:hypothetical protein